MKGNLMFTNKGHSFLNKEVMWVFTLNLWYIEQNPHFSGPYQPEIGELDVGKFIKIKAR